MRILHFADLHLGVENYGKMDPAAGLHSRLLDFLRAFDFIVETALSQQVDLALFCGDAFRSREPSPTLQCLFAERIRRLADAEIPLLLLLGNHDLPPLPGRRSSLEIYPILDVPNIQVITTPGLRKIQTRSGALQIACLPARSSGLRVESSEPARLVKEMAAQVESDCPAILAGHVGLEGARVGTEGVMAIGREIMLPRGALLHPQFCYIALGHAHRFQDLNAGQSPPLVYCGSPERVDFSEEQEPKGFVIVEINAVESSELRVKSKTRKPSALNSQPSTLNSELSTLNYQLSTHYSFIQTPARRFITIEVNLKPSDTTAEVLEAIAEHQIEDAVVKVILRSEEEAAVDEKEIRRSLSGAHFALPVSRQIEKPPARLRAPALASGWDKPLSALDEYLKTTRLSEERKQQLRRAAEGLIREEDKQ